MIICELGDIVLVPFPFSDQSQVKKRPALVIKSIAPKTLPRLAIVAMITSTIEGEMLEGDYLIKEWSDSGLLRQSKLRLAKLVTIEERIILKKLGVLQRKDFAAVTRLLKQFFKSTIPKFH